MDEAFESLVSIAIDEKIIGSSSRITSGDKCICFSEAPQNFFHEREGQFKPFGIRLSKKWLFSLGGRPVIYQPADEFDLLPDELAWRHVNYELNGRRIRDYTWQREWRIRKDCLDLPTERVTIIIPHERYRDELKTRFFDENYMRGLAMFEPYGYGMGWPQCSTSADLYRVEVINS